MMYTNNFGSLANKQGAGKKRLSAYELELLVGDAQQGDQQAVVALCQEFEGMFKKLVKPSFVRELLGYEDALQSCYVFFLEAVYAYKGKQWNLLPGLFQRYTRFRLYRELGKEMRYRGSHYFWLDDSDSTEESYRSLLEDPKIYISEDQLLLDSAFKLLTPLEKELVYATCLEDKTLQFMADKLKLSLFQTYYHRQKALQKLLKAIR